MNIKYYNDNLLEVIEQRLPNFLPTIPKVHHLLIQMKDAKIIYNDICFKNSSLADEFASLHKNMSETFVKFETDTKRLMDYR